MAVYDNKYFNLSTSYSHPTQGGLDIQAQQEITDIDLITAYLSLKGEGLSHCLIPNSEAGLFFIYYGDDRDREGGRSLPWVDNRPLGRSIADTNEISIYTYGIHFLGAYPLGPASEVGISLVM